MGTAGVGGRASRHPRPAKCNFAPKRVPKLELRYEGEQLGRIGKFANDLIRSGWIVVRNPANSTLAVHGARQWVCFASSHSKTVSSYPGVNLWPKHGIPVGLVGVGGRINEKIRVLSESIRSVVNGLVLPEDDAMRNLRPLSERFFGASINDGVVSILSGAKYGAIQLRLNSVVSEGHAKINRDNILDAAPRMAISGSA